MYLGKAKELLRLYVAAYTLIPLKQACTAITYIFHVVDSIAANALLDWYSGAYSQSYSNTRRYQSIGVTEAGLEVYTYMYIGFTAHTASRCIWKI